MKSKLYNILYLLIVYSLISLVLGLIFISKKNPFTTRIIESIRKVRGTEMYTGEDLGNETILIFSSIILPSIFMMILIIHSLYRRAIKN